MATKANFHLQIIFLFILATIAFGDSQIVTTKSDSVVTISKVVDGQTVWQKIFRIDEVDPLNPGSSYSISSEGAEVMLPTKKEGVWVRITLNSDGTIAQIESIVPPFTTATKNRRNRVGFYLIKKGTY